MADDDLEALLRADHRNIEHLLEVAAREHPATVKPLLRTVGEALAEHEERESWTVYSAVRTFFGDEIAAHAVDEHQCLGETLVALDDAEAGTAAHRALLRSLVIDLAEHVAEEEKEILPMLRSRMTPLAWSDLGHRFRDLAARPDRSTNKVVGR
jgi:hypothetical protein